MARPRFSDMSAPAKVTAAFSIVLATIIVMGVSVALHLSALQRADLAATRASRALQTVESARFFLARQENSMRGYLLSGQSFYLHRIETLHRPGFLAAVERIERLSADDPAAMRRAQRLRAGFEAWRTDAFDRAISLAARPETHAQALAMIGQSGIADRLMDETEAALSAIEASATAQLDLNVAAKARAATTMRWTLAAGIALTAAVAGMMGVALVRLMGDPIRALTDTMQRLAAGENDIRIPELKRRDEAGRMAAAMAAFQAAAVAKAALEVEAEARRRETEALAVKAEAANRAKTEFLATVTHELRTPLNGVLGMAQLMAREPLAPAQQARLNVIAESGEALLRVINDILDISKIEAGKLEIRLEPFDLGRLCDDLAALYRPLAAERGLVFVLSVGEAARGWFLSDPVRLRQIASNLLSNALKFTEAGEIRLEVDFSEGRLSLAVADTGVGVPADRQPQLFDRFVQADASATRRHGGAGLGLAICKELAERLGGAVTLRSTPGQGSRFTLDVPMTATTAPAPAEAPAALEAKVLVVDDNAVNRTVLLTLLEQFGVEGHGVIDGVEAVEAWEAQAWDAILMDIHMPRMDGVAATRRIREEEAATGRRRTPIIAVTASALAHEAAAYAEAGMDACVPKPVEVGMVLGALEAAIAA